jgi:adenosine deaminase
MLIPPSFFSTFSKLTYQICNDLKSLVYATNSVLQDFLEDGVVYLELRTIPRASPGITDTVLTTIENFRSRTTQMSVSLILAVDRGSMKAVEAEEIVDLAIANKPRGVVGVDICGNPTKGDVSVYRDAFARAKSNGLGITLHFAETKESASHDELSTLLSFMPDRLGHVIHVSDELKRLISQRRLGLELCLSCNVHAKMINGGFMDHHFGYWRDTECPIALCVSCFFCYGVSSQILALPF